MQDESLHVSYTFTNFLVCFKEQQLSCVRYELEQRLCHIESELVASRKELMELQRKLREKDVRIREERQKFKQEKQQAEELMKV